MSEDKSVFSWVNPAPKETQGLPLSGLRLAVKDLYHIAGLPTGAGNPTWLATHDIPEQTSSLVQKLLDNGATPVGKTQTDELAYSLNGNNMHYGVALNAKAPDRLTGGSSSGSASAVAQGLVDIGLGSDTGGSIRVPASYCGLYGMRTTHGLLSLDEVVPLAPSFDTAGWFCRDLETYEKVAEVLFADLNKTIPDKATLIQSGSSEHANWNQAGKNWFNAKQEFFKETNTVYVDEDWFAEVSETFRTLQGREVWQTHGEWITEHKPVFAEDIQMRFDWCKTLTEEDEEQARKNKEVLLQDMFRWCPDDSWVAVFPTTPGAAPLINASADSLVPYRNQLMGLTSPAGLAGWPQLHLPVFEEQGAPWGISILARAKCDRALLKLVKELFIWKN